MIKFQIITTNGIDVQEKEDEQALIYIQEYVKRHHPWLYLDGQPTNTDEVTINQLQDAQFIVLSHVTMGG
jgi:hypothetical protein